MLRSFPAIGILILLTSQICAEEKTIPPATKAPVDYERDVKPLLTK